MITARIGVVERVVVMDVLAIATAGKQIVVRRMELPAAGELDVDGLRAAFTIAHDAHCEERAEDEVRKLLAQVKYYGVHATTQVLDDLWLFVKHHREEVRLVDAAVRSKKLKDTMRIEHRVDIREACDVDLDVKSITWMGAGGTVVAIVAGCVVPDLDQAFTLRMTPDNRATRAIATLRGANVDGLGEVTRVDDGGEPRGVVYINGREPYVPGRQLVLHLRR